LRVQKERTRLSLKRVDGLGQALRTRLAIRRKVYKVPRPNHLWHLDGHHKLIWWGFVIHGFIDGYCRTVNTLSLSLATLSLIALLQVTGLRASTNNKVSTVLEVFLDAVQAYGTPSRVRGDRGGENTKVSVWMILHRGPGRASFMWGSCVILSPSFYNLTIGRSTRNTHIERLWVEVGTQFARRWRAFFTRLGRMHSLDRKNPAHLWLLHRLFLDELNEDCREFQEEWNHHPMSGNMTGGQSPEVSVCLFVLIRFQLIGDTAGYAPSGTDHPRGLQRPAGGRTPRDHQPLLRGGRCSTPT
jgi:hypothetical protein